MMAVRGPWVASQPPQLAHHLKLSCLSAASVLANTFPWAASLQGPSPGVRSTQPCLASDCLGLHPCHSSSGRAVPSPHEPSPQ